MEIGTFFILQMMFLVIILAVAVVMMYFVSRNQSVKNIFQKEENITPLMMRLMLKEKNGKTKLIIYLVK